MFKWLIIDGNNLIYSDPNLRALREGDFDGARRKLARDLDSLATTLAPRISLVFDGTIGGKGIGYGTSVIDVEFSSADMTADGVIERIVYNAPNKADITVVTSDRVERDTVEAAGAHSISCKTFLEDLAQETVSLTRHVTKTQNRLPPGRLGDFFPD